MFRKRRRYLDWASAAPASSRAQAAFRHAFRVFGNPSSPHAEGRAARTILEEARRVVARHAGAKPEAVVFTSGATEANGIAIRGHVKALRDRGVAPADIHILYVPSAHSSVIETIEALKDEDISVEALSVSGGAIDLIKLKDQVRENTVMVCVDIVCGETGTRFDVRGVRRVLDEASPNRKILIHADATQAPLVESIDRTRIAADLISLDASKIGGVRGIGVLIAPPMIPLASVIEGGGQERGLRSGTQSHALAASFAKALSEAMETKDTFSKRAREMRERFVAQLSKDIPSVIVNGGKDTAPHIINISLPGIDTEYLAALLDEEGFSVSTRSACETDAAVSRAVLAFTGDNARASATLRVSWGPSTPERDLMDLVPALVRSIRFLETT